LAQGEHKSVAYLKINPHGKVPALAVDNTVLTENVAILTYLARRFPETHLLPNGTIEEARCLSMMAWFASAVHTSFAHIIRPERFATDSATHSNLKDTARGIFWDNCKEINDLLVGKAWIMGPHYTVCDPYVLFFLRLGHAHQTAHARACRVHRVLQANAGPLRGIQGTPVRGGYIEGHKCVAWTILRAAPTRTSSGYCQFVMASATDPRRFCPPVDVRFARNALWLWLRVNGSTS
jgi:glutathione S-transferase